MRWWIPSGLRVLCAIASLALPAVAQAAEEPDSAAQAALFSSDHLKNVSSPVKLTYSFVRRGEPGIAYEDSVVAEVRAVHPDGGKDVWIHFLTGEREMATQPVTDFHGNPLLMYFLEHDVREMRQETGFPATYFRNRVRRAFYDGAHISQVTLQFDGQTVPATDIEIVPFGNVPDFAKLPGMAGKTYHFVLCDRVPGTIYQISSHMPAAGDGGGIDELMTYSGETP